MSKPSTLLLAALAAFGGPMATALALDVTDQAAVIDAFRDHTGAQIDAGDLCVETDPAFPIVAVVGSFAHDLGCVVEAVLVGARWYSPTLASEAALSGRGWATADDATRAALALKWTAFGAFTFRRVMETANDDFAQPGAPDFAPPTAEPDGAGSIIVTLWVEEPSGMLPETAYNAWQLFYDRDGKMVRIRVLASHRVEYGFAE